MQYDKKTDQWVSIWTEGRNTQLSKFGYVKWDILGLKNLSYIKTACEMIRENHGISFGDQLQGWDDSDQINNVAGYYWENGEKKTIPLEDPAALKLANDSQTDSIFQFDTELAKRTLSAGVHSFRDLLIFNAMGHPGPMQCLAADTLVSTNIGNIRIDQVDHNVHKIKYVNSKGNSDLTDNYRVFKTGRKKVYRIRLSNGATIKASANHWMFGDFGIKPVGQLSIKDKLYVEKTGNNPAGQ